MKLGPTAFLVPDYDEGIAFLCEGVGLTLLEDTDLGGGKRWVVVGGADGGQLLVARTTNDEQNAAIGNQFGGRVGLFAFTDDFAAAHHRLTKAGATFEEDARDEPYGRVAVFRDPLGNRWDLLQKK